MNLNKIYQESANLKKATKVIKESSSIKVYYNQDEFDYDYYLIELSEVNDDSNILVIGKYIEKLINKTKRKIKKVLIVGLGNSNSTADSLGPRVVGLINVSGHLSKVLPKVYAISPGVIGQTGIETFNIIKAIVNKMKFDLVIVIDSLATVYLNRLSKVVQISNSEISPGSALGRAYTPISKTTLNVEVIIIGVGMLVETKAIINDVLDKLKVEVNDHTIDKILNQCDSLPLLVTSKDIDFQIDKASKLISSSINNVFFK